MRYAKIFAGASEKDVSLLLWSSSLERCSFMTRDEERHITLLETATAILRLSMLDHIEKILENQVFWKRNGKKPGYQ